ncbi:MAG: hypothetical protein PHU27_10145, partial [Salinivirgaceae bacterium]|nr:hypothetical protein [Salinivirgaceae bacterium]
MVKLCHASLGATHADSLAILIEPMSSDDVKIESLMKSANQLRETDMTSALKFYNQALQLAQKTTNYKKIAELNLIFGSMFFYSGNYDRVLTYYYEALKNYVIIQDTSGFVAAFFNIALVYN